MNTKSSFILVLLFAFNYFSVNAYAADKLVDVNGNWVGIVALENGRELPYEITLSQQGSSISGVLAGIGGPDLTLKNIRLEGNILYYSSTRPINGDNVLFDYIAVISADFVPILASKL